MGLEMSNERSPKDSDSSSEPKRLRLQSESDDRRKPTDEIEHGIPLWTFPRGATPLCGAFRPSTLIHNCLNSLVFPRRLAPRLQAETFVKVSDSLQGIHLNSYTTDVPS